MTQLNLSRYGIADVIEFSGAVVESPATEADPLTAPIVFLVDEEHETPSAIQENAENVARIVSAFPDAIVVLEHFPAGEPVTGESRSELGGSDFHVRLSKLVSARMIGGDDPQAFHEVKVVSDEWECRLEDVRRGPRDPRTPEQVAADEERVRAKGREAVGSHRQNLARSQRLIEMLLAQVEGGRRIGIINAGSHHNTHAWENSEHNGQPICQARSRVTLIRLRPVSHPTPLVIQANNPMPEASDLLLERRRVAAYFHWVDRGRPLWEELVDWDWAVSQIPEEGE